MHKKWIVLCCLCLWGCADEQVCEPKARLYCVGANDCAGARICADDGTHYKACVCPNVSNDMTGDMISDASPKQDMTRMLDMSQDQGNLPPVDLKLSAMPERVEYGGQTRLSWSVYNATECEASDGWSGQQSARDGTSFALVSGIYVDTTFVLTCSNASHKISKSVSVKLNQ